ncbi:MAG TPA: hypothetical protein VEB66_09605 [Opitutaceae bacterium]|nr:hypothetical protein [Opitutaceae bacterium]
MKLLDSDEFLFVVFALSCVGVVFMVAVFVSTFTEGRISWAALVFGGYWGWGAVSSGRKLWARRQDRDKEER